MRARTYFISTVFAFLDNKASELYGSADIIVPFGSDLLQAEGSRDFTARAALYCVCVCVKSLDRTAHVRKYFNGHCPLTRNQRC